MKKRLGAVLVSGLGIAFACCGSDTGARPGARLDGGADARADVAVDGGAGVTVDVGILPLPVLDPKGTYGGKTVAEWGTEWQKWIFEYPGPESLAFNTPGATCEMGQSMAMGNGSTDTPPFFLALWDSNQNGGTYTQTCTVPIGRTILFQMNAWWADSIPECISYGTEANCLQYGRTLLSKATALELEIDGKSYGSQVADFAPYLTGCTHLSAEIPNSPDSPMVAYYGCTSTESVLQYDAWQTGYWMLLAPLAPGPHTIHTRIQQPAWSFFSAFLYEVTYNLTVADTSTLGSVDAGPSVDAALPVNYCTGAASSALIDDMSGSNISLAPPSCGSPGGWTAFSVAPGGLTSGVLTSPAGDPSVVSNCGSLCQSLYGPLPAGFPGTMASLDASAVASGTADGGASGVQAMCISGQTGSQQYSSSGMALTFAHTGTGANGTGPKMVLSRSGFTSDPPPALIDASQYSGIEFWLWASPETAAALSSGFIAQLIDKKQLPGGGVCFPSFTTGSRACGVASAGIPFSTAAASASAGPLLGADGSELTALAAGWQLVRAPWTSFLSNSYYGGGNEKSVDPTTLAFAEFVIQQDSASSTAIPFAFCVHGLQFYK